MWLSSFQSSSNLDMRSWLLQVARGLPVLPKVPLTKAEARRRRRVMLLPLGMALLAAQAFVEQRLYSADICKNVIEDSTDLCKNVIEG